MSAAACTLRSAGPAVRFLAYPRDGLMAGSRHCQIDT
jgi:hypothetical protein